MKGTNDRRPTETRRAQSAERDEHLGAHRGASSSDLETGAELLPEELLWAEGGHASDVVLTAVADGQANIVPTAVRTHIERCSVCTSHLGHAALLSLHAGAELAAKAEHERLTARRPLPRLAIALGLAVAAIGLLPSVLDPERDVSTLRSFVTRDMPLFVQGLRTLAHRLGEPGSTAGLFLTYAAAVLLVAMAIAVVRILPNARKETSR